MMMSIVVVSLLTIALVSGQDAPVPVVLWHGMGDSAAGMVGIAVSDQHLHTDPLFGHDVAGIGQTFVFG